MLNIGKWLLCGAVALPIGFGIGYALDAKLPQASATTFRAETPAARPSETPSPSAREKGVTPERPAPTPVTLPARPAPASPPAAAPAPVAAPAPAPVAKAAPVEKGPAAAPAAPRFGLDKGSITLEDDEVKIRTPYGSIKFSL